MVGLHAAVGVHMHQRAGLVEQRGRERDAELDRRDRDAALNDGTAGVPARNLFAALRVVAAGGQGGDEGREYVVFNPHAVVRGVAQAAGGSGFVAVQVGQAHGQRVQPEVAGDVAEDGFGDDHALRAAKAAKSRVALRVGFAAVRGDGHVF